MEMFEEMKEKLRTGWTRRELRNYYNWISYGYFDKLFHNCLVELRNYKTLSVRSKGNYFYVYDTKDERSTQQGVDLGEVKIAAIRLAAQNYLTNGQVTYINVDLPAGNRGYGDKARTLQKECFEQAGYKEYQAGRWKKM